MTMHHQSPVLPGNSGMKSQNIVPDYEPERQPGLHFAFRRIPAALRVANPDFLPYLGTFTEEHAYAAVRFWLNPDRRKRMTRPPGLDEPEHALRLRDWLIHPDNKIVLSWWNSSDAWRSPREFWGYSSNMAKMGLPHIEPFEVAHFRLPDDISCDPDVVLFQAWCQGWSIKNWKRGKSYDKWEERPPLSENYPTAIRSGLQKFCRSPYVRFAIAAPFMNGAGVKFGEASLFDSGMRMEYLIRNPFMATDSELSYILTSPVYTDAFLRARVARKGGKYLHSDGGWYAGGSINRSLGSNFKRGGLQPPRLKRNA